MYVPVSATVKGIEATDEELAVLGACRYARREWNTCENNEKKERRGGGGLKS